MWDPGSRETEHVCPGVPVGATYYTDTKALRGAVEDFTPLRSTDKLNDFFPRTLNFLNHMIRKCFNLMGTDVCYYESFSYV